MPQKDDDMPTITRKIELKLCTKGLSKEERKAQRDLLFHISNNLYRPANNISSKLYLDENISSLVRLQHREYKTLIKELDKAKKRKTTDEEAIAELERKLKVCEAEMSDQKFAILEKYEKDMPRRTLAYHFATEMEEDIRSEILAQIKDRVYKDFTNDKKEVRAGKRSIRTYKKGMPIPFPFNKNIQIEYKEKTEKTGKNTNRSREEYDFFLKWYKCNKTDKQPIRFRLHFGKDRSNNYQIVKRCLNLDEQCTEKYEFCTSSIQIKTKGKETKFYLLLVVEIPQKQHTLNKDIVVGVDLGINVPAYVATNITEDRIAIGDRKHFLNMRTAISERFHELQRLKGTASGKGRKKKLAPLERMKETERNWVHTQNHRFSHDVINFALKVKAATIHIEDLAGYGKDKEGNVTEKKKFFLRKWSYHELQNMIKYKAEKAGITVNYINPAYTSQTCSWCGQIGKRDGTSFFCENPKCEQHTKKDIHADHNAARNIAKSKNIVEKK